VTIDVGDYGPKKKEERKQTTATKHNGYQAAINPWLT